MTKTATNRVRVQGRFSNVRARLTTAASWQNAFQLWRRLLRAPGLAQVPASDSLTGMVPAGLWLVALMGTLGLGSVAAAGTAPRGDFSAHERSKLAAGELVRRPMARKSGELRLLGGTSYQVINAPLHVVWQALLDTTHYHRMMPQVLEARLVEEREARRTVYMRQGAAAGLAETSYYLNVTVDEAKRDITFRMDEDRPHDLRAAWGFYNVRSYGDGSQTLLTYGVMADVGRGFLMSLARDAIHEWMLRTPWMVKRFVEGSGRHIYQWQPRRADRGQPSDRS